MTTQDIMPVTLILGGLVSLVGLFTFLWKMLGAVIGIKSAIGQKYPPDGLLGDVQEIKEKQEEDHEKIVVIEAGMAKRRQSDK